MEVVNHLEDSQERISTGNLYTPPSMHTHMHILFVTVFPPVLTWMRIYDCFEKVTRTTSEIPHFTELHYYGAFVRQPNAMSVLQLIYSNICKNIWGEEETNVHFQFQHSKEINGHRGFTNRKHRNKQHVWKVMYSMLQKGREKTQINAELFRQENNHSLFRHVLT